MTSNPILTQKEKELVALAASIASGCQPCTKYHIQLARESEASEEEVSQAIDNALWMRNRATQIMAGVAGRNLSDVFPAETKLSPLGQPIQELVFLGAALACNSAARLEDDLRMAKSAGASERQIQTTLGIARAIRKEAVQKAEAVVEQVDKPTAGELDDETERCCQNTAGSKLSISMENVPQPCGCGKPQ